MTTTTGAWPEQLRLPGQEDPATGPVDLSAMYVMHHAFRRDLAHLGAAATATPASDRAAWAALAAHWADFAGILHHHHSGEDAGLWPALLARCEAEDRATLDAMEAEHERIDPLLASCGDGFLRLAAHADDDARAALAVRLCALRRLLGDHLRHEETGALPIVQRLLSPAEWEALEREHFVEPMGLRQTLAVVPWALHEVPGPVLRRLFALPRGRAHQLLWVLTRRRFARRTAVAFRHLAGA